MGVGVWCVDIGVEGCEEVLVDIGLMVVEIYLC